MSVVVHLTTWLWMLSVWIMGGAIHSLAQDNLDPDVCLQKILAEWHAQQQSGLSPKVTKPVLTTVKPAFRIGFTEVVESPGGSAEFLKALRIRAVELQNAAAKAADPEAFYQNIRQQAGEGGYFRALEPAEVEMIFDDMALGAKTYGSGKDFSADRARVGHARNFIFIYCKNCDGIMEINDAGGGMTNIRSIPLSDLEIIVPRIP